jgi:hypothetical protein
MDSTVRANQHVIRFASRGVVAVIWEKLMAPQTPEVTIALAAPHAYDEARQKKRSHSHEIEMSRGMRVKE